MIPDQLQFHHMGMASATPERTQEFLMHLGYTCGESVHDPLQNVHLCMCTHPEAPDVEVISPTDFPGPLDTMLSNTKSLIYHTCYTTSSLETVLEEWEKSGMHVLCISEPTPAVLFDHKPVSFYMIRGFGLIELLEV